MPTPDLSVYDVRDERDARAIILTPQDGLTTDDRWRTETPYLVDLIGQHAHLDEKSVVLDYGCGIGRMSKALIERYGCTVVGADSSWKMLDLAVNYVELRRFRAVDTNNIPLEHFDLALSVWVLQHTSYPDKDLDIILRSLKATGSLFVVNELRRCVPVQGGWTDDGIDVRGMLGNPPIGRLDPAVVGENVSRNTFWALVGSDAKPAAVTRQVVHPAVDELNKLAVALSDARLCETAAVVTKRAIVITPNTVELWTNLSSHYFAMRRYEESRDCARRALTLNPEFPMAWDNLGIALEGLGQADEAEAALNTALVHDSDSPHACYNRAMLRLNDGDYDQGWTDYEARIQRFGERDYPKLPAPLWQGESLVSKSIYVYHEQGVGDSIVFSRFVPWLAERAAKVYVYWPHMLASLMWDFRRHVEIVPENVPIPPTDYAVYMGSLPGLFGARLDDLLPDPGLIRSRVEAFTPPIEVPNPEGLPFRPFRVGICWTGNAVQNRNADRTVPLRLLVDLASDPHVWLYSLQVGSTARRDIEAIGAQELICDQTGEMARRGLAATGSAMLQLDLVVTCCTSIAHLAGALGIPAWVMVPENPYWVWGRNDRETSPWWPSLRLFRQEKPFEWEPVVGRIKDELHRMIGD